MDLRDPEIGLRLVIGGGCILAAMGVLKLLIYIVGERFPGVYKKIPSEAVRQFMTGSGNRLLFGLGGLLTIILGLGFVFLGFVLRQFSRFL